MRGKLLHCKEKTMQLAKSGRTALRFSLGLPVAAMLCAAPQAQAVSLGKSYLPSQLDLSLGMEAMSGDTQYEVGGSAVTADGSRINALSPTSRLEWPLDVWLTRVDAGLTFSPEWHVNVSLKTNLGEPDNSIIDRDWLTVPGRLDLYSESKVSSFDALLLDIDLEWTFWQQGLWSLYAGAGWQHQKFQYTGSSLMQYSPSGLSGWDFNSSGRVSATYELTYSMPYLLLGSEYQLTPQLRLNGSIAAAPLLGAEDETILPLRNKTATGDMDGGAWMLDISGSYWFNPWWHLKAGLRQAWLKADGEQHQTEGGQPIGMIDMESTSSQTSGYLNVGYSF